MSCHHHRRHHHSYLPLFSFYFFITPDYMPSCFTNSSHHSLSSPPTELTSRTLLVFLQRVRILACNVERCNSLGLSVRLSVCLSVCLSVRPSIYQSRSGVLSRRMKIRSYSVQHMVGQYTSFWGVKFIQIFAGDRPSEGVKFKRPLSLAKIRPIISLNLETVQDSK